jgi:hypothetical protein
LIRSDTRQGDAPACLPQVPGCLDACNQRFQGVAAPDDVSWADLHAFYSMPDTLRAGVLKQAGQVFADKLKAAYLCMEEAWRDDVLRQQFCKLPLGAVEALAALDELKMVSENTVATALATWLAHDLPGREAAGAQLLGHIRLHHLSQCYVREVLPHLPGLGQHLTVQQLLGALQYVQTPAASRGRLETLAALKPARAQPSSTGLGFEWRVSTAGLLQLVQQALQPEPAWGRLEGDLHRYNGFALRPVAETGRSASNKPYLFVSLEVGVPPELSKQPSIASTCALVSGTVQVPGSHAGELVNVRLDWRLRPSKSKPICRAYVWKLQLGEGAVHDMGTLVAALVGGGRVVRSVAAPAPAVRVAQLGELPLVFNVTACA